LFHASNHTQKKRTGDIKWTEIAEDIRGRNGKQCRERWYNHLRPDLKKGEWTKEEDERVALLQQKYGNAWAKISFELGNRTDNDVKNRWHSHKRTADKIRRKKDAIDNVRKEHAKSHGIIYDYGPDLSVPKFDLTSHYKQAHRGGTECESLDEDSFVQSALSFGSNTPTHGAKFVERSLFENMVVDEGMLCRAAHAIPSSEVTLSEVPHLEISSARDVDHVQPFIYTSTFLASLEQTDSPNFEMIKSATTIEMLQLKDTFTEYLYTGRPTKSIDESFFSTEPESPRIQLAGFQAFAEATNISFGFSPMIRGHERTSSNGGNC